MFAVFYISRLTKTFSSATMSLQADRLGCTQGGRVAKQRKYRGQDLRFFYESVKTDENAL
jgi:hypothetical protein